MEKLARKITERALLKLIVPGVNVPIAYGLNRWFTTKLGRLTIRHVKRRAACLQSFLPLRKAQRTDQLNALALIYHVGIQDEPPHIASHVIEMQDILARHVVIADHERDILQNLILKPFDEFVTAITGVDDNVRDALTEIAITAHVLSDAQPQSKHRLLQLGKAISQEITDARIGQIRRRIEQ